MKINVQTKVGQMQTRLGFFKLYGRPICESWINSSTFLSEIEYVEIEQDRMDKME